MGSDGGGPGIGRGPAGQDVAALRAEIDQLRRALAGRTAIDQAFGMVMVLAPCGSGAARGLLADVSRQCDVTLREVAAALIAAWEGEPLPWRTQQALRRALRRFYAEDRGVTHACRMSRPEGEGHDSRS